MSKVADMLFNFGMLCVVYTRPVHESIIAVTLLVGMDFFTGILAARKKNKPITSHGFRRTITKTFVYQASIIFSLVLEKQFVPGIPAVKVVTSLIALTETKSFFENVEVLTGINFYKKILSKFHGDK